MGSHKAMDLNVKSPGKMGHFVINRGKLFTFFFKHEISYFSGYIRDQYSIPDTIASYLFKKMCSHKAMDLNVKSPGKKG